MTKHKSKCATLALRLEPELRERLEAAAEQDRRVLSNLIRNVLADWVDGHAAAARHAGEQQ
jgi:hypothetical protein